MNNKLFYIFAAVLVVASATFWIYMFQTSSEHVAEVTPIEISNEDITLTMYHGEGCECCVRWADYLRDHGVTVEEKLLDNPHDIKNEQDIPARLRSCHTGIVDGYVIEGHVPIEDIRRLLAERPEAIGISAPGMPPNSPGMDAPISREYHIILFDENENMSVYATHN